MIKGSRPGEGGKQVSLIIYWVWVKGSIKYCVLYYTKITIMVVLQTYLTRFISVISSKVAYNVGSVIPQVCIDYMPFL